jgi:hypothetical protein
LAKGKDGILEPDAAVTALARRPIGNKAAKATALEASSSEKIQSSINKCLMDVSSNLLIRDKKASERWVTLLWKQEEKMLIKKERVAVKKRKEDFMLLTASRREWILGVGGAQLL